MRNTDKKRKAPKADGQGASKEFDSTSEEFLGDDTTSEAQDESLKSPSLRDLILSAGAALDDLDAPSSALRADSDHPANESVPASKGKKRRGKKPSKREMDDTPAENRTEIEWNESTSRLDFTETPEPTREDVSAAAAPAVSADVIAESAAMDSLLTVNDSVNDSVNDEVSPFEELARKIAQTVATRGESPFQTQEEPDTSVSEATPEFTSELDAALASPDAIQDGAEAASEPMEQMGFGDLEEKIEAAENDADPEPTEFVDEAQLISIVESMLFSTDKPVSVATMKVLFKGTNIRTKDIGRALDHLASDYAAATRGIVLEEVTGGFQLRTKTDNANFLRRLNKVRPFKLSGPSLEVMAIVAYRQPITKHEIDEIRGVESGHLLRALMERGMLCFNGKSDLPGKPMSYGSTRKFLETFGLRNLRELPTLSEIDEIMPDGIGEPEEKESLADLTERMSTELTSSYSEGEEELDKINQQLKAVDTTSEFFEQEKQRERDRRDHERAQDIREKTVLGDAVEEKDRRWLARYDAKLLAPKEVAPTEGAKIAPNLSDLDAAESAEFSNALENLSTESEAQAQARDNDEEDSLSPTDEKLAEEDADMPEDFEARQDWDDEANS